MAHSCVQGLLEGKGTSVSQRPASPLFPGRHLLQLHVMNDLFHGLFHMGLSAGVPGNFAQPHIFSRVENVL